MTKTLIAVGQTCGPLLYVCVCVLCAKWSCFLFHIQYSYTKILLIMQFGGRLFHHYVFTDLPVSWFSASVNIHRYIYIYVYICVCERELYPYTTQNRVSKHPYIPAPFLSFTLSLPQIMFFLMWLAPQEHLRVPLSFSTSGLFTWHFLPPDESNLSCRVTGKTVVALCVFVSGKKREVWAMGLVLAVGNPNSK